MADGSRFLSKTGPAIHERADVKAFLNQFVETGEQIQHMRRALEDAQQEIASLKHKIAIDKDEIERLGRERKEYLAAAGELRIQLETIVTGTVWSCDQATAACKSVIDQAKLALTATRDQMRSVNLTLPGDRTLDVSAKVIPDEAITKFGETFGYNTRKPDEPLQP